METVKAEGNLPVRIEALKRSTQVSWQKLGLKMDGLETGLGAMDLKEKTPPRNYRERRINRGKSTPTAYPFKSQRFDAAAKDTYPSPIPTTPPFQPHVEHAPNESVGGSRGLDPDMLTVRSFEDSAAQLPQDLKNGIVNDSVLQSGKPLVSLPIGAQDVTNRQLGRGFIPYEPTKSVPLFRKVPPWRIDKLHRFSSTQALQNNRAADAIPFGFVRWTDSLPPTARYNLRSLTTEAYVSPTSSKETKTKSRSKLTPPKPPPVPNPEKAYLALASRPANRLHNPQRLLLVLDLNGALLYRKVGSSSYTPRPLLPQFLSYCLSNHKVLVWSSATPGNVSAICARLFTPEQRKTLLGEWARDTFGLTPAQYVEKTQVYKRLDRIWANETLQYTHHWSDVGGRWGQHNTLLLDDSVLKASAQPHNLVQMPEFTRSGDKKADFDVLGQVISYLEEARMWDNVSSFVRNSTFEADKGWSWDWAEMRSPEAASTAESEEEDGGVRI